MHYKMGDLSAEYSVFVSNVVDIMGYSMDTIRQRRLIFDDWMDEDDEDRTCRMLVSGSKGEGTTSIFESDVDLMCAPSSVICTAGASRYMHTADTTVIQTEHENASPGYTYLKCSYDEYTQIPEQFVSFHVQDEYISNMLRLSPQFSFDIGMQIIGPGFVPFVDQPIEIDTETDIEVAAQQGPSIPVKYLGMHADMVIAITCEFPDIAETFLSRHRKFNQPTTETLEEVVKLDCHVVAVGSKRGDRPDLEWRISYTQAELHLMRCLNETQIKVYILLKLLAKSNFGDSKTISSYILKNIVLWMSEFLSRDTFRPTLLVPRLLYALRLLRHCVKNRYLPNYMIPERNMFCGKLKHHEYMKLLQQLTKMVDESGNVLFMCSRLKQAMVAMYESPIKARCIGNIRDAIEQWYIQWSGEVDVDDEIGSLVKTVCKIEFEEYRDHKIDDDTFDSKVCGKLRKVLL